MKRLLIRLLGKNDAYAIFRLSLKHKVYCAYFGVSFCTLCVGDETPIWIVALIMLNFGNSVRLIKKVTLK